MNKRKKVAWRKHRIEQKKIELRRKQAAAQTGARPPARGPAATGKARTAS